MQGSMFVWKSSDLTSNVRHPTSDLRLQTSDIGPAYRLRLRHHREAYLLLREDTDNRYTSEWFRAVIEQRKKHRTRLSAYRQRLCQEAAAQAARFKRNADIPAPILRHGDVYLTLEDMAKFIRRFTDRTYSERYLRILGVHKLINRRLRSVLIADSATENWEARIPWCGPRGFRVVCRAAVLKPALVRYAMLTEVIKPQTYANPLVVFLDAIEMDPTTSRRKLTCALSLNEYRLEKIEHYLIQIGIIKMIYKSMLGRTYQLIRKPPIEELDEMVLQLIETREHGGAIEPSSIRGGIHGFPHA